MREFECPEHGDVSPSERQHGGRAHAFVCPVDLCNRTVKCTSVDWGAYRAAVDNDEKPPCPRCKSNDITEVPVSGDPFRCGGCSHAFGYAGAYY
jgi:hypothetical protein